MVAMELKEKLVCIITGGASGIGKETAKLFAKNGHRVVIADRTVETSEATVNEIESQGGEAAFVQLDIADEASVQASIDFALSKYARIDTAVNCAGIGGPSFLGHEIPAAAWRNVVDIDLHGTFYFTKAMVAYWLTQEPRLLRDDTAYGLGKVYQRGALVNIASVNAHLASFTMGGYVGLVAAKHGVLGLSKNFAYEQARNHIRINTVSPGCVYTPIMQAPGFNFNNVKEKYLQNQAIKRFAHPAEIATANYFLCSDEASFCTGTDMLLDAGWSSH